MSADAPGLLPTVIDLEASGFGAGSYPIEVGYYTPDGDTFCTLIRPEPEWTHWDASAEAVHGIRRELLFDRGRAAGEVCRHLNDRFRGQVLYSDAWGQDYAWLGRLFDAADMQPGFTLKGLRELMRECETTLWHATRAAVELKMQLRRHRASSDARLLFETLLEARKRCAPDW